MAFGRSCLDHGLDWRHCQRAVSMQVVQDPGGTTPEKTGNLCFVCNSGNRSDKTAQHNYDLWRAAVSLKWGRSTGDSNNCPRLRKHYWTNAVLHGAPKGPLRKQLKAAARVCSGILAEQVRYLEPQVLIGSGEVAAESFLRLGYIPASWNTVREKFEQGPFEANGPEGRTVFCTYHTSIQAVNGAAASLYKSESTETRIARALDTLPDARAARAFLEKYADVRSATNRGMRVLLLHWLRIGQRIRAAEIPL